MPSSTPQRTPVAATMTKRNTVSTRTTASSSKTSASRSLLFAHRSNSSGVYSTALRVSHSVAYTKLRLLHRDVSAGNVIIRPALSPNVDENGKRKVTWTGILTDWELAKIVPEPDASGKRKEIPRQPERTGTWQFMSAAYIMKHPYQPVSVADELESFFHVLLFYAVRLLLHNVADVRLFVTEYFDSFTVADGARRGCSHLKQSSMKHGAIELSGAVELEFHILVDPSKVKVEERSDMEVDRAPNDAVGDPSKADADNPSEDAVDDPPKPDLTSMILRRLMSINLRRSRSRSRTLTSTSWSRLCSAISRHDMRF
ncbi:hypothetical protein NUW54_g14175 [Trametes sanguinea]|uniref:Uncharacterized protein n=1 Tax=Trametes sanguinea TaxID=158606 RepID=A0ACC1MF17_9APHY|nr:hypothetical protein NUW54_g14175 [Trametes sanguinea]